VATVASNTHLEEVLDLIFASGNLYQFDSFGTHLVAASV
jgi:hypothetical protein